ncbi:TATA box-binding protein-like 2 [Chelmon rostratus]|uniref:TATA box-binding protein-like 2 n=1 Tax=Chelmon rostratus TaxID=109905 RepID=UPI001BE68FAE|nr:TATA box-binding protein-like 2 [Chelmon rostratus]
MDKSALEWYFDHFIANDASEMEREDVMKQLDHERVFFILLPDELLTLNKDNTGNSSTRLDYNSQNSTAAAMLPGGSSMPDRPTAPIMPVTQRTEIIPQIHNVLSTVHLGCCLDLNLIASKAWNVEYKPKSHRAVMRHQRLQTTAVIYKSGKIVCAGSKSVEQSHLEARKYARIVQKLGFPARFLNFQIRSFMASCNTFPLRLEKLAHHQHCSYEPELFSGLSWKVTPNVTANIFSTGKIILMGAKKEAEIHEALDIIFPVLSSKYFWTSTFSQCESRSLALSHYGVPGRRLLVTRVLCDLLTSELEALPVGSPGLQARVLTPSSRKSRAFGAPASLLGPAVVPPQSGSKDSPGAPPALADPREDHLQKQEFSQCLKTRPDVSSRTLQRLRDTEVT